MIDRVVIHLHEPPCLNKKVLNNTMDEILDNFWKEFDHFATRTGSFAYHTGWFNSDDAMGGRREIINLAWNKLLPSPSNLAIGWLPNYVKVVRNWICWVLLNGCKYDKGWKEVKSRKGNPVNINMNRRRTDLNKLQWWSSWWRQIVWGWWH